ncbi:MAG: hypothetical protein R2855_14925 [Thermomicrobiales bacterium]
MMQFGMHNAIDLQRLEMELRDHALARHHLVVDARLRNRQLGWIAGLSNPLRALFTARPNLREERGTC